MAKDNFRVVGLELAGSDEAAAFGLRPGRVTGYAKRLSVKIDTGSASCASICSARQVFRKAAARL